MQNQQDHTAISKQPLISFIVTYHDLPIDLLQKCLDSILALSLSAPEREIILIDDGSETSPLPMLDIYKDNIVYVRQPNGGLSQARNTGIRISTGIYLQFIDGDDMLVRTGYEHCMDLARYKRPDIVMFRLTDKPQPKAIYEDSDLMSGTTYMRTQNVRGSACGYLFKRSALSELRFTPGILHEDEEFTPLLLLRADSIIATNADAYFYLQREASIITNRNVRHIIKRLNDNLDIIRRLYNMADRLPRESKLALTRRVHQMTMDFIYQVICLTKSRHYLNRKLKELSKTGLYPLPKRDYTKKYKWFRRLANSETGLSLLMRAIPLMKKER